MEQNFENQNIENEKNYSIYDYIELDAPYIIVNGRKYYVIDVYK